MKPTYMLGDHSHPAEQLRDTLRRGMGAEDHNSPLWIVYDVMDAWEHQEGRHGSFIADDLGERYDGQNNY